MITTLVLFGASGDLAGRYLLPSLAAMTAEGSVPAAFTVIGAAREDWEDHAFRHAVAERLEQHAVGVSRASRDEFVRSLRYRRVDVSEPGEVPAVLADAAESTDSKPVAAYLAVPPAVFPPAITGFAEARLPAGSRIAIEKPFGDDLASAIALNGRLARLFGEAVEDVVFRVDHALGMATSQTLLGLRTADGPMEPYWNRDHIEAIDVLWEETLALEGRAGYYDRAGALKDVLQNHMLQLLCLLAMEPPADREGRELHDRKVEVLRSLRPIDAADVAMVTQRARYTAGRLAPDEGGGAERTVPAYTDEDGVDPARRTETFAEILFELDTPRWAGMRFRLRAGKALAEQRRGVVVRFRSAAHQPWREILDVGDSDELRLGIDGPAEELPAYGRVLRNFLDGGSGLAVRGDEAEAAWRVVTPVLEAWVEDRVPLLEYPAGSAGPAPLAAANTPAGR